MEQESSHGAKIEAEPVKKWPEKARLVLIWLGKDGFDS